MIYVLLMLAISGLGAAMGSLLPGDGGPSKVFLVTNYGAKGDGVSDDGPAIKRAIAAAVAAGGRVSFPCGEFSLQSVTGAAPGGRSLLYFRGAKGVQLVGLGHCS